VDNNNCKVDECVKNPCQVTVVLPIVISAKQRAADILGSLANGQGYDFYLSSVSFEPVKISKTSTVEALFS